MDSFFTFLKKTLLATTIAIFATVMVYTPQDWNKVEKAEAVAVVCKNCSTIFQQLIEKSIALSTNAFASVSAAADSITSWATNNLWVKEYLLDGIAWKIAKSIISSMISSLIKWINSGFKGSPMFVQDLEGFLRNAADIAIGDYIQELGGPLSFLCDPFKLDVQIAVALEYQKLREGTPLAGKCTLSGVLKNIESFTSGTQGSFANGGWDAWFDITSNPTKYTPYGATLAAQNSAYIRILNTKNEEAAKINWGSGFLSGEICNIVSGPGVQKEECFISKPGKVIQEALSFNIDSGRQSLISADEIDEILAALLGQLAQTAFTGAAGLLGLSGGTGYTKTGYSGGSYLSQMVASSTELAASSRNSMVKARNVQNDYATLALNAETLLTAQSVDPLVSAGDQLLAKNYAKDATTIGANAAINVVTIDKLITDYDNAPNENEKQKIISQFGALTIYTESQMESSRKLWEGFLGQAIP